MKSHDLRLFNYINTYQLSYLLEKEWEWVGAVLAQVFSGSSGSDIVDWITCHAKGFRMEFCHKWCQILYTGLGQGQTYKL